MRYIISHPRHVPWGGDCPASGTKGVGKMRGGWDMIRGRVVEVVMPLMIAKSRRVQTRITWRHGGSRATSPWKRLWPRNGMGSFEESALVAELPRSHQTSWTKDDRYQVTYEFPLTERRAAPRRRLGGLAIEALATYTIAEFHPRVISKDRPVAHESGKWFVGRAVLDLNELGWRKRMV